MTPLKMGVVGTGHLGFLHARTCREMKDVDLVGVVDSNPERAAEVGAQLEVPHHTDAGELFGKIEGVVIAVPTKNHSDVARAFLERDIPVFVEKPLTHTIEEGEGLVRLARERKLPLQVGHVERFNPAVTAVLDQLIKPRFIEVHRLAPFSFRSTDINVVMDLMIHDLDIILHVARSPVKSVQAVGVSLLFGEEDIANARIEFEDGCVANLTASRVSAKPMRKIRFFSEDRYIAVDTMAKKANIYKTTPELAGALAKLPKDREPGLEDIASIPREFYSIEEISLPEIQPIEQELSAFVTAIREGTDPLVTGEHGLRAMRAAESVVTALRSHKWT